MGICLPIVGAIALTIVGVPLLLYGRTRFLRRIGALMGSVPGPCIIWLSGKVLLPCVNEWLRHHPPSYGDTHIFGQDITMRELLWIPLQDAGFYVLAAVILIGGLLFRPLRASSGRETFTSGVSFDRWLDTDRKTSKPGWLVYRIMTVVALVLALPVTGLASYVTMPIFLARGDRISIPVWIDLSVLVAGAIYTLVYYIVNSVIVVQDEDEESPAG